MTDLFSRPLLATEHTEFDGGAEALAFALAQRCGRPLAGVLPITSNDEYEAVAPEVAARSDADASSKREQLQAQARAQGVALDLRARHGPEPFAEIVEEARERAADLIVIRRRGKRGLLANLLVGEMVSKVVAHAPCSVLVAPRDARMWSQRVLVGIDPRSPSRTVLAHAATIAAECGIPLLVLCVAANEPSRAQASQDLPALLQQAREHGASVAGEVLVGRPHAELIAAAARHRADLIVIARGHDSAGRARIGSTTQQVIGLADCPVLVHVTSPGR
jgi:nucleotide-binding universal stress UspA family protein